MGKDGRVIFRWIPAVWLAALAGCGPVPVSDNAPASPEPRGTPAVRLPGDMSGVWATRDENGTPFDIVLFPNGQAVTTFPKGPAGVRGERGFWRTEHNRAIILFDDGWTDTLSVIDGRITHCGYAPGEDPDSGPRNSFPAEKFGGPAAVFVGVWRLNKEPDGSYLYVTLQSGGAAFSTINGLTEGKWTLDGESAKAVWPDGWVDRISRSAGEWQKVSSVGESGDTPSDLERAVRVGETRFTIEP